MIIITKYNHRSKLEKLQTWRAWRRTRSYSRGLKLTMRRLKLILWSPVLVSSPDWRPQWTTRISLFPRFASSQRIHQKSGNSRTDWWGGKDQGKIFHWESITIMKKIFLTQVNDFLQVSGHQNIFAVGDCCNTQEHKMAAFAGAHGETVARNIIKEVMGCTPTPYKRVSNLYVTQHCFIH